MSGPAQLFGDGQAYERLMGRWSRLAGQQFLDWLDVPKGLAWLDVGCGNGAFTETIIARCAPASVEAIDPSEGQLAHARSRPAASLAKFQQADSQALPFGNAGFDVVVMGLVITFIPDPAKAVREMARVARPGAMVATYMWDIPGGGLPMEPINLALESLGHQRSGAPRASASQIENMHAYWAQAGLHDIETRVIRINAAYDSFDDFWISINTPTGPSGQAISALSPAERDALQARLREMLTPAPDGRIVTNAFANAVKGRAPG